MSWTVRGINAVITEAWDHCEHLAVGDIAPHYVGENDSFAPVHRYGMCSACHTEYLNTATEICDDCYEDKPVNTVSRWRPYDFHGPSGDTELHICSECKSKSAHLERVANDKRARDADRDYWDED